MLRDGARLAIGRDSMGHVDGGVTHIRWFSRASIVESTHLMVSQRPVELAALIRWDEKAGLQRDAIRSQ
jgi:hypothetical protein